MCWVLPNHFWSEEHFLIDPLPTMFSHMCERHVSHISPPLFNNLVTAPLHPNFDMIRMNTSLFSTVWVK